MTREPLSSSELEDQYAQMQGQIVQMLRSKLRKNVRGNGNGVFNVESTVLYNKMEADHHAYLAEFLQQDVEPDQDEDEDEDEDRDEDELSPAKAKFLRELGKALECYKTGMKAAVEHLSPTSPLRLQLAYAYATCLYDLANTPDEAIYLARSAFDLAYNQMQRVDIEKSEKVAVTRALQMIRDNVAFWESEQALIDSGDEGDDSEDGESWGASSVTSRYSKKSTRRSTKSKSSKSSVGSAEDDMAVMEERCLSLMKVDPDLQLPLQVDSILPSHSKVEAANHALVLVPALFELFSLYAEDKAPSALNVGNNGVLLGSNRERVDFSTFLLNAHKGALGMTLEAFLKLAGDFQIVPKLLELDEVEALARISICARRPVLMCGRRREGGWGKGGRGEYTGSHSELEPLKKKQTMNPNEPIRLQHSQFVDCLARIALVSYSMPPRNKDFPSTTTRLEDFFCDYLGLLNQSETTGWRYRVGSIERQLRSQIKTRLPSDNKRLGYGRSGDSNASSADFKWTMETESLVNEPRFLRSAKLLFESYRKLTSVSGGVGGIGRTFDSLYSNAQQLQANDFLKFAADFFVAPQLLSKERLISIYQAADKFTTNLDEFDFGAEEEASTAERLGGSSAALTPEEMRQREYELLKAEAQESHFFPEENHGFRVFADSLVRAGVEVFSKREFRESGQFASQAGKVLAFFYHLQLHESLVVRKKLRDVNSRGAHNGVGTHRSLLKSMSALEISQAWYDEAAKNPIAPKSPSANLFKSQSQSHTEFKPQRRGKAAQNLSRSVSAARLGHS